jgi:hypothetical protein
MTEVNFLVKKGLTVPKGSASTPSVIFDASDPNTGLYSPGADQVAVATNGVGRLFVDASGRVGVGTASPGQQLDIYSSQFAGLGFKSARTGSAENIGGPVWRDSTDTVKAGIQCTVDGQLKFGTGDNTERLRITSAGLVGIGTSSPSTLLHLSSATGSASPDPTELRIATTTNANDFSLTDPWGRISFYSADPGGSGPKIHCAIDNVSAASSGASSSLYFKTSSNTSNTLTTRLAILGDSGNVGIGTTSPGAILHTVNTSAGAATVGAFIQNSSITVGTEVRLGFAPNANVVGDNRYSWIGAVNGTGSNDSALTFATAPGGAPGVERMRIDSSGRLLVGTSTTASYNHLLQVRNDGGAVAEFFTSSATAGVGPYLALSRSRGSAGSPTVVSSGDNIGTLFFSGYSGSAYTGAAEIKAEVDGTPGVGDMPGRLVFSTTNTGDSSPTERLRIDDQGQAFLVTENNCLEFATIQGSGTSKYFLQGRYSATVGTPSTGTVSFKVTSNGDVTNTNNSYGAISDIKLKENIADANSQWSDIKALQVRNYNFKEGQTHTQIGLVAQEVELVSPGLVTESPDRDADGNDLGTVTKSVNYSVLYMKAVKALQEAMERIEQLETSNADLLARVTALEAQ